MTVRTFIALQNDEKTYTEVNVNTDCELAFHNIKRGDWVIIKARDIFSAMFDQHFIAEYGGEERFRIIYASRTYTANNVIFTTNY